MLAYTGESLDDIVADGMEESWKVARENWFAKTGEDDEATVITARSASRHRQSEYNHQRKPSDVQSYRDMVSDTQSIVV